MISTLDLDAAVIKSDTAIASDLKKALRAAAAPLEEVPHRLKDRHSGSDGKILNLVDPSLFPLIYGRSRVLPLGLVGLDDCVNYTGKGEVITSPDDTQLETEFSIAENPFQGFADQTFWSESFQWLPCDVKFVGNDVKITSYINNLHPTLHPELYSVIEKVIAKSIPLWNLALSSTYAGREARIVHEDIAYDYPLGTKPPEDVGDGWRQDLWLITNRELQRPEPRPYQLYQRPVDERVNLRKDFGKRGLQVIVKLASIELTPEKPTYEGGVWHVEGQLNERICATAHYYYDSKNIGDSFLGFRHGSDPDYAPEARTYGQVSTLSDLGAVEELYGIHKEGLIVQQIGRVLTKESRLLAFPNVFQHRVLPFRLSDPSVPGHRKLLALFLVDPYCRIISTAKVPPQQKEWWGDEIRGCERLARLPKEIVDQFVRDVDGFPIDIEEAKEIRGRLMEERMAAGEKWCRDDLAPTFAFCEH